MFMTSHISAGHLIKLLKWESHIDKIAPKANKSLSFKKLKPGIPDLGEADFGVGMCNMGATLKSSYIVQREAVQFASTCR